ncbi:hypothetical protein [Bacillus cereus]|uniref:hypothetical protein n=1 Tax=Bacillus cereus TaxID=1396 RepID=UPI0007780EEC|nr:hypothetical protein [Bacillus cereus]UUE91793.1 hypothetical protein L2I54_27865 [Bacillus cereus]
MRHTRNRQLAKLHNEPMWFWNKEGTDDIRLQRHWMKMGLEPKLDPTFMWLRIQYENDKKVRNYWGIAGTYARKIK